MFWREVYESFIPAYNSTVHTLSELKQAFGVAEARITSVKQAFDVERAKITSVEL